jgi:heme oxygenase
MEQERREVIATQARARALAVPEGQSEVREAAATKAAVVRVKPITAAERLQMIAEAAYLRAERRGFAPGGEVADWLAAETEVDALLARGRGQL